MKKIPLKQYRLSMAKHCFVIKDCRLTNLLQKVYGRQNLGLKVFDLCEIQDEKDFYKVKWGDDPLPGYPRVNSRLWEATQIQNIAAWSGLAPRIYGLETVKLAKKFVPLQVMEWTDEGHGTHEKAHAIYQQVINLGKTLNFGIDKSDVSGADIKGKQLVDFQTLFFKKGDYLSVVKDIYREDGKYGKVYYQDEDEIGFTGGPRKSKDRIKDMGLDRIDFKNKSVLDIGCAGGFFCRYAIDRGARRVVGIDTPETIKAARHVSNYLGYFNIDYVGMDLRNTTRHDVLEHDDITKWDVCFFLSMNYHIDIPQYVLKQCETVIFEDNGKQTRNLTSPSQEWQDNFKSWRRVGAAKDHGNKSIYHLSKSKPLNRALKK